MLFERILHKTPIDKGWSGDKKYRVTTDDGGKYLLRVSPPEKHDRRKQAFARMQQAASLGIPMARPVEFGVCDDGVYTIEQYVAGVDAEGCISGGETRRNSMPTVWMRGGFSRSCTPSLPLRMSRHGSPALTQKSTARSPCTKTAN